MWFQHRAAKETDLKKESKRLKKSLYPEVWIRKNWPAIRIGAEKSPVHWPTREQQSQILFEAIITEQF